MTCSKCKKDLSAEDFPYRNLTRRTKNKVCKSCHQLYRKQHYLINKSKYIEKAAKWNTKQKEILTKYLFAVLSKSECIDCGEKDIIVLDFDHIENKKLGIAEMFRNRYSITAIETEIKKCVVRCANCHRRKTSRERDTWKYKLIEELRAT